MNCKFTNAEDKHKMNPTALEDFSFHRSCIFKISDFLDDSTKSIKLYSKEFLVEEVEEDTS